MVKLRQTLIIIFIFLLIFVMAIDLFAREKAAANSRDSEYRKNLISITIDDYRAFLKTHLPLDRLYCQGDICFFLVNSRELSEIEASGAAIRSRETVPDYFLSTPPADSMTSTPTTTAASISAATSRRSPRRPISRPTIRSRPA